MLKIFVLFSLLIGFSFTQDNKPLNLPKGFKWVVEPTISDGVNQYREGYGTASFKNERMSFYDVNGKKVYTLEGGETSEGFYDGIALIEVGHNYKYILNKNFVKTPIPNDYKISNYSEGFAIVSTEKGKFYVDKNFKKLSDQVYASAELFSEGLAYVRFNDKLDGFINTKGKVVIADIQNGGIFTQFKNGLCAVQKRGKNREYKFGYIDKKGELVIPILYLSASDFYGPYACVSKKNDNDDYFSCFIDVKGNILANREFNGTMDWSGDMGHFFNYFPVAGTNNSISLHGYMDKTGKDIIKPNYYNLGNFNSSDAIGFKKRDGDKSGIMNKSGIEIIPPLFKSVGDFYDNISVVEHNGGSGYLKRVK
ncbi:MAG: WG repeat-containing protein [Bacteroidota bacterium]|nr:WG repeat-containing protein [Bacteroidota bacterium]